VYDKQALVLVNRGTGGVNVTGGEVMTLAAPSRPALRTLRHPAGTRAGGDVSAGASNSVSRLPRRAGHP
jgi:hypothetical protein